MFKCYFRCNSTLVKCIDLWYTWCKVVKYTLQGKKNSKARIDANNRYNAKAYDRINIAIPKGQKETVQKAADREGLSINAYIIKAVLAQLGLDKWPEKD